MLLKYINMKTLVLSLFTFLSVSISAQNPLTADAGPDLVICSTVEDGIETHFIGGQPSATGGVPPYTYSWSFSYPKSWSNDSSYASDFFNDTTLANPTVVWMEISNKSEIPPFVLMVTDANGNSAKDSVQILMSWFAGQLIEFYPHIILGDSFFVFFGPDVHGGVGPASYLWRPNNGLTDSTLSSDFYIKPDSARSYYVTLTDSVGCTQRGNPNYIEFTIWPVGIEDGVPNINIKVYPNPASDYIQIERIDNAKEEQFTLYDILGKVVLKTQLNSNNQIIEVSSLARGSYSFVIGDSTGKIILK
ncbi:MAG: hypothetical protein ACI9GM_000769 [Salibacteraceae bacterium]|jgi:hypothetical protein